MAIELLTSQHGHVKANTFHFAGGISGFVVQKLFLCYCIPVAPDKVGDTLDSARSRRRRTDFLRDAITQKIFALGLSNLVFGSSGGGLHAYCFVALAFQK